MDLRTDSVNDVLKHYGISPGSGRTYIADMLSDSNMSHGLFGIQTKKNKED